VSRRFSGPDASPSAAAGLTSLERRAEDGIVRNVSLTTIGAVSALVGVACFVTGVVFLGVSGVQVLIPETGSGGLDWIADVQDGGNLFRAGGWLIVIGGMFLFVAIVGYYDALREVGPAMVLAPVLGAVGFTLVTISHVLPIALASELVPAYVGAGGAARDAIAANFQTLASFSLLANYFGDLLLWSVVTPLVAYGILRTRIVPRWVGWVGLIAAVFAGWLGLFSPLSGLVEAVSSIGFLAFFVFNASFGITLLLRRPDSPQAALAPS